MNHLFKVGAEFVGEVGFGVIKNSGRLIYGGGQTLLGVVAEDDELLENGVKNLSRGAFGLTIGLAKKAITGDNAEDSNEDSYFDSLE